MNSTNQKPHLPPILGAAAYALSLTIVLCTSLALAERAVLMLA